MICGARRSVDFQLGFYVPLCPSELTENVGHSRISEIPPRSFLQYLVEYLRTPFVFKDYKNGMPVVSFVKDKTIPRYL